MKDQQPVAPAGMAANLRNISVYSGNGKTRTGESVTRRMADHKTIEVIGERREAIAVIRART